VKELDEGKSDAHEEVNLAKRKSIEDLNVIEDNMRIIADAFKRQKV
jgi:hypothetical protein